MKCREIPTKRTGSFLMALLGLVVLFSSLPLPALAEEPDGVDDQTEPGDFDPAPTVFGPGERMVFSVGFGPISAGEGILEILGLVEHNGRTCYRIQSSANSNRYFSSMYRVRDKILSYIDVEQLNSRYFYKRLREGDYKKTVEIDFDQENHLAMYAHGDTLEVAPGVQDVLSAFFYVRNLDLVPGTTYPVPAHSSRKTYDLQVIVHGMEEVEVEAGKYECFVVEPVILGEGLFKSEGKMTLYITNDANRVPVLIKTKIPVGSIDVELKEYRPGRPLNPK